MIDWYFLAVNSLWILGLSIMLAALSYHHWLAHETDSRLRDMVALRSWRLWFSTGMLLVSLGFASGRNVALWERTLWTVLAFTFSSRLISMMRHKATADRAPGRER